MTVAKQYQSNYSDQSNSEMNKSEFLAITWNLLKAREKSRDQSAIGIGSASHWLKNCARLLSQSLSEAVVITFDGHWKIGL